MIVEVCANSVQSALNAQEAGAQRVELCSALNLGGLTPSASAILMARALLEIDLFVLIRPREGDFCYTDLEFEQMAQDILFCKESGCDGVVIGILKTDGSIDVERTKYLVELAAPMEVTFHRAFDYAKESKKALEDIIETGCKRILTSGCRPNVIDGIDHITTLIQEASDRITIMPGGGVNDKNLNRIIQTGAGEVHLSGRKRIESQMEFKRPYLRLSDLPGQSDYEIFETNKDLVKQIIGLIKEQA
jgi:copper homeostasis protein